MQASASLSAAGHQVDTVPVMNSAEPSRDLNCLPNPDAAGACPCSCHPRPGNAQLHDGGLTCSCQLTAEQRTQKMTDFLDALAEIHERTDDSVQARAQREHAEAEAEATRLGARLLSYGGLCPLVVRLVVDGHGVYLRSRHEQYQVAISGSEDPWNDGTGEDIAYGAEEDLWLDGDSWVDPVLAVRAAVCAARRWQVRDCDHAGINTAFCGHCGSALSARFGGTVH